MVTMVCRCGTEYDARLADLNRGWGRSCSKSCAASRRDFGGKAAKRKDGIPLTMAQPFKGAKRKTPDKRVYYNPYRETYREDFDDDPSWDAHKDCF
jgi:hypothetical protein